MKIGSTRICLTPKTPFHLIGYRSDNRYDAATGIHDDIYANVLLFEHEGREVFLFSADFLEFEEEMAEEVKTMLHDMFHIERNLVLLCATHNHSSIVAYHKTWYTKKFDAAYYAWLFESIKTCYKTCRDNAQEAYAKYGVETILGYYGNRNHPGLPADNEVMVLKFYNRANEPFAGIVNWAVHSTVISAENTELTSELAGNVSKKLFASFHFFPAMVVGAAGDCSNRNERQGNDFNELERVSSALANHIAAIPCETPISLDQMVYKNVVRTIHHDMSFVHEEVRLEISKLKKEAELLPLSQRGQLQKRIVNLTKKLSIHEFHLDAKGSIISFGGLHCFIFPGELGSAFGKQLKQACEVPALICGYTNGYYEYFMPKEEYGLSFETIGSPIPRGEAEKMIEQYIEASKQLSK